MSYVNPFYHDSFLSLVITRLDLVWQGPADGLLITLRVEAQMSAPPHTNNRIITDVARDLPLRGAGVHPSMAMTPEDLDLANRTPYVASRSFSTLFGGNPIQERPQSKKWGTLCVNRTSQPYAPHSPGKSGLVFVIRMLHSLKIHVKPSSCSST